MKCDGCGCQFPAQEAVQDTRGEFGPRGRQAYRIAPITLCPECASRRRNTLWFFVALAFGPAILGLLIWLFGFVFA